jgi:hypothetical protein
MLMDSKHIEQLLEKYWSCETSLEEEQQLREYFSGENLPPQWRETSELFRYFEHQKKGQVKYPAFDEDVMKKIRSDQPRGKMVRLMYNVARIAAGLLVVVVATFLVRQEIRKSYPKEVADTYSDPKLAFEETKKALMMISKGFGRAQKETRKINMFNEAERKIEGKKEEKKESSNI